MATRNLISVAKKIALQAHPRLHFIFSLRIVTNETVSSSRRIVDHLRPLSCWYSIYPDRHRTPESHEKRSLHVIGLGMALSSSATAAIIVAFS